MASLLLVTLALGCAQSEADTTASTSESSGTEASSTDPMMTSSTAPGESSMTEGSESSSSSSGVDASSGSSESTGESEPVCGDGAPERDEPCDDGNDTPDDGCENDCSFTIGIAAVETGEQHSCALTFAGAMRCWGDNSLGQLGYGHVMTIGDDETPADVGDVDVGARVVQLALGGYHTCALIEGGAVRCWGWNGQGQLGYGHVMNLGDDEIPADSGDIDLDGIAVALAAGGNHTCALLDDGDVRCWGTNSHGQLGLPLTYQVGDDEAPSAAPVVDVGGVVTEIATGGTHTCALLEGGSVRCWGYATSGQLGYGNEIEIGDDESPADVGDVDFGTTAVELELGNAHVCVRTEADAVRCWGWNANGQLGYGTVDDVGDDELPATVGDVEVGMAPAALSLGGQHSCALSDAGSVRCWGANSAGRLGYGHNNDIGNDELPSSAGDVDVGGVVLAVAAGGIHTCALLEGNTVRCWGEGTVGSLGYGNTMHIGDSETPASAGDVPIL